MKLRIEFLDFIKAFTIFTVIWGHLLQYINPNFNFKSDPIFTVIYSFHMPLFYLISDMFFKNALKENIFIFLRKKFNQLIVPCLLWGFLFFIYFNIKGVISDFKSFHIIRPIVLFLKNLNLPFWYLKEVFISYLFLYFLFKIIKNEWIVYVSALALSLLLPFSDNQRFLLPFFITGSLIKEFLLKNNAKAEHLILIISGLIFTVLLFFWKTDYTIYYTEFPNLFKVGINYTHNYSISILRFFIGLTGSLFIILGLKKCYSYLGDTNFINKVGQKTLSIYIIQTVIFNIFIYNKIKVQQIMYIEIETFFIAIFILIFSYYLALQISKFKILNKLFLGDNT